MRELILEYLEFVDDVVDELDSREEIELHPADHGNGQRRRPAAEGVSQKTGDLKKVVDYIIEETEVGPGRIVGSASRGEGQCDEQFCRDQAQPINTIPFDPELTPGARNAVQRVPARTAVGEGHGHHGRSVTRDRGEPSCTNWKASARPTTRGCWKRSRSDR